MEQRLLLSATLIHEYAFNFNTFEDNAGAAPGTMVGGEAISGETLHPPGSSNTQGSHVNYATLPAAVMTGLTSASIEGWFTIGIQETGARLFMAGESSNDYIAFTVSDPNTGKATWSYKAPGSSAVSIPTSYALRPGIEYYFAANVDAVAHSMSFYIGNSGSASLVGTASLATANGGNPGDLSEINFSQVMLGNSFFSDQDFNGTIEDFRIYNGVLPASQIASDPVAGSRPDQTNTDPFGVNGSPDSTMYAAGVKWVRASDTDWKTVSPSQGTWDWSASDAEAASYSTSDMYGSGILSFYMPSWLTAQDPNNSINSPITTNELAAFSSYVTNVVTRYHADYSDWEIGNEPQNIPQNPAQYAALVTIAYNDIKAIDPYDRVGITLSSADVNYLQQVLQAGAADHFDYIDVHPYELAGYIADGEESLFINIAPTMRKMLAAVDPSKANVPIDMSEVGVAADQYDQNQTLLAAQAQNLWKVYALGIAGGIGRIDWYSESDPYFGLGLLDYYNNNSPNPAYYALEDMTSQFGTAPQYLGWVLLNNQDYGLVFQGATTTVMACWAQPGATDTVNFGQNETVYAVNPTTGAISTSIASSYSLTNSAVLVTSVPASLVTQAIADKSQSFPWTGNVAGTASASVVMGATNTNSGLFEINPNGSSTATTWLGSPARYQSTGSYATFSVDPNFLAYTPTPITITAVVSRDASDDYGGFNLVYESSGETRLPTIGWNSIPEYTGAWQTITFTISDDMFVNDWGYSFFFNDIGSPNGFYIKSVSVTRTPPAAPSGLTATAPNSTQANLSWTDNSTDQSSFLIDRATNSGFSQGLVTLTAAASATSYVDSGLSPSQQYYYRIRATNPGGTSANSASATATTPPNSGSSVPVAPSLLTAATVSNTQINLSWSDNSNNETSFEIDRSTVSNFASYVTLTSAANFSTFSDTGLAPATPYYYRVRAVNGSQYSAYATSANGTTWLTAPSGLTLAMTSPTQLNLTWIDNSSTETGFVIQRATDIAFTQNLTLVTTTAANVTSYANTGLADGTFYFYRVWATNALTTSAYSNLASVYTALAAASSLFATGAGATTINLSWVNSSTTETGFVIQRATDSGFASNLVTVTTTAANATSYSDTTVTASTLYYYRIQAENSQVVAPYSNTASATTPAAIAYSLPPSWVAAGSAASWNAVSGILTITGATSIIADPGTSQPIIQASGTAAVLTIDTSTAKTVSIASLTLSNGASVVMPSASTPGVLIIQNGNLSIDANSTVDLGNNGLDLQNGAANLGVFNALIQEGFSDGTWTGTGITSSAAKTSSGITALGVLVNGTQFNSSRLFEGLVNPGANDVLVKYTYYGDADLSGAVDGSDYSRIDFAFLNNLNPTNTQRSGWQNGDFNYDGVIDGSDYTLIDNAFNSQSASFSASPASLIAQSSSGGVSLASERSIFSSVDILDEGRKKHPAKSDWLNQTLIAIDTLLEAYSK